MSNWTGLWKGVPITGRKGQLSDGRTGEISTAGTSVTCII